MKIEAREYIRREQIIFLKVVVVWFYCNLQYAILSIYMKIIGGTLTHSHVYLLDSHESKICQNLPKIDE